MTDDKLKQFMTTAKPVATSYAISALTAEVKKDTELADALATCGMSVLTIGGLAKELLEERAKVETLERQLADTQAELAIATGRITPVEM